MAYIFRDPGRPGDWLGPYPNLKGEFVSNHDTKPPKESLFSRKHGAVSLAELSKQYTFGRPRTSSLGTSEELIAMGTIGLYLKVDLVEIPKDSRIVDTDCLTEDVVSCVHAPGKPFCPDVKVRLTGFAIPVD